MQGEAAGRVGGAFGSFTTGKLRQIAKWSRRRPMAAIWGGVGLLLILMAIAAPVVAPADPNETDFAQIRTEPNREAWFGTDDLGRDVLSRIIFGARASLFISLASTAIGLTIGAALGVSEGYLGGKFDLITQRFVEVLMAIPGLLLALLIAFTLGSSAVTVIIAIAVGRIPSGARVIRSVAIATRNMPFVDAARATGASQWRIMFVHITPQTFAPFIVLATINLGTAILIEASLGFLGLGVAPPTPTWGGMLGEASASLFPRWWLALFPGIAITLAVLAANLAGDGLRDIMDPRTRGAV